MTNALEANQSNQQIDLEIETLLTSFDTSYAWNYGNVKEGLATLYEKAKNEQWNSTTQLAWDTNSMRIALPEAITLARTCSVIVVLHEVLGEGDRFR